MKDSTKYFVKPIGEISRVEIENQPSENIKQNFEQQTKITVQQVQFKKLGVADSLNINTGSLIDLNDLTQDQLRAVSINQFLGLQKNRYFYIDKIELDFTQSKNAFTSC